MCVVGEKDMARKHACFIVFVSDMMWLIRSEWGLGFAIGSCCFGR